MKRATGIDRSTLTSKINLVSLRIKVVNLDVDKSKTADLSKLSNVVDNYAVVKKTGIC